MAPKKAPVAVASVGAFMAAGPAKQPRSMRCGTCDGCQTEDCGSCSACKDKKKFGGPAKLNKACLKRICEAKTVGSKAGNSNPEADEGQEEVSAAPQQVEETEAARERRQEANAATREECLTKGRPAHWPTDTEVDTGKWIAWLPAGWGQGIKKTMKGGVDTGKTLKCYIAPDGKRLYHRSAIEEYLGTKFEDGRGSAPKDEGASEANIGSSQRNALRSLDSFRSGASFSDEAPAAPDVEAKAVEEEPPPAKRMRILGKCKSNEEGTSTPPASGGPAPESSPPTGPKPRAPGAPAREESPMREAPAPYTGPATLSKQSIQGFLSALDGLGALAFKSSSNGFDMVPTSAFGPVVG